MSKRLLFISGNTFFVKDTSKDYHSKYGFVKKEDLEKTRSKTNTDKAVLSIPASFVDIYHNLKRGAQIITLKDASSILAYSGIDNNSVVVDAGTGSGFLTCFLARYAKKVYSFDNRNESTKLGKKNAETLNLTNIEFENKDITEGIDVESCDTFILDLPNPIDCLNTVRKVLKSGGFLVCYLPTIVQVVNLVDELGDDFIHYKTIENMEREWHVHNPRVRPISDAVSHTAFLVFIRRV